MKVVVIDGQGGRIGKLVVEKLAKSGQFDGEKNELIAIGTNTIATAAMLKAGAPLGATGDNPAAVNCVDADVVVGPIGIIAANALLGEVTPKMAAAVGQSEAVRILIPVNRCDNLVAGVQNAPLSVFLQDAVAKLRSVLENKGVAE